MKSKLIVILVVFSILVIFSVSVILINNYSAYSVEKELLNTHLPDRTVNIDSISSAGKIVGSGNGMQYLGAILLESELSLHELDNYYSEFGFSVQEQTSSRIDIAEHASLSFKSELSPSKQYYIVYSWGDGVEPFKSIDLRGR